MDPSNEKRADFDHRASWRTSTRLSIAGDDGSHDVSSSGTVARPDPAPRPSIALALPSGHDPRHSALARGVHLTVPSALADDTATKERPRTAPGSPSSAPSLRLPAPDSRSLRHSAAHDLPTSTAPGDSRDLSRGADTPHEQPSRLNPISPEVNMSVPTHIAAPPISVQSAPEHRGPTHPYNLYPQSALASDAIQTEVIPVGFPGITHSHLYGPRIGQGAGVTGSFTGSVGHTEELPPYSRYPAEGYGEKAVGSSSATEAPAAPTVPTSPPSPTRSPTRLTDASAPRTIPESIAAIPGAGGIGLATRDPEFSSTSSDMGSPRLSARSFPSDVSQHNINTAVRSEATEKGRVKSWQRRGSKKICGIVPYWAVVLLTVALILMGTILGAVIGTFLSRHRKPGPPDRTFHRDFNKTDTVIPMKAVPQDLPDLEVGEWGLPPWVTTQAPSSCVAIPTQAQAWTCNPALDMYYVEVGKLESGSPTSAYQLKITTPSNTTIFNRYAWGTRAPVIPESKALRLVNDTLEQGWGPAWWLRVPWNKIVVLPEDRFSVPSEIRRRVRRDGAGGEGLPGLEGMGEGDSRDSRNSTGKPKNVAPFPLPMAKEGDKPWICTWPDTELDVFIYAGQNNSFNTHGATFTGFSDFPTPTGTGFPGFPGYPAATDMSTFITTKSSLSGEPTPTAPVQSATDKDKERWPMPKFRPPYPKIMKISESRALVSTNSVAFCEQVEIIDGGKDHRPVLDKAGKPIRVNIAEKEKDAPRSPQAKRWSASTGVYRRDGPGSEFGECGCIWVFE